LVDLGIPEVAVMFNYAEGLVTLDEENNWVPCLAQDWRWTDDRTIEFKLRQGVTFHNGEKFNAETVKVNWEQYKGMENPRPHDFKGFVIPDETIFEIIDEYTVRFRFPGPEGLVFLKFFWFPQIAPTFFTVHKFHERSYGYLEEAGPWGTGPFKLVKGSVPRFKQLPSDEVVLQANRDYWDPKYPKVQTVIFDNTLIGDRKEAMRLCRETEGDVDLITYIRPLDTLKVAESRFAKVLKNRHATILGGDFNQRKKDSKWRDIRLRKAANYAINREELWKYGAKGNAYNLEGFPIPPGAFGHNPNLTPYAYDTTKAKSLLVEAGYPEGFEVKIIVIEAQKLEAQIISRMLERIGLKVTVEVLTNPEMWRRWYIPLLDKSPEETEWDIALMTMPEWAGNTAVSFLTFGLLEGSRVRWIEYDQVLEEMFEDMAITMDSEAQEEKIRLMVQHVHENAYFLTIYSPVTLYAVNKEVDISPRGWWWSLGLKETSVTENHWSVRGEEKEDSAAN
jgi:peptide/nickel transport system substrate-binding protein